MIKKLKKRILDLEAAQYMIEARNKEVEWANIYHDSIRGKAFLKDMPIYPGRWAVGYSFLYVLNRILGDYKPKRVIEFGLGESSKLVSSFVQHELPDTQHVILEQSEDWVIDFSNRFKLSDNSEVVLLPLAVKEIQGHKVNTYDGLQEKVQQTFDLYLVDGPHGSNRYSRYDIVTLAQQLSAKDEFIIIIDDTNRIGERDTIAALKELFEQKGIKIYSGDYVGTKTQTLLATEKYRFCTSL